MPRYDIDKSNIWKRKAHVTGKTIGTGAGASLFVVKENPQQSLKILKILIKIVLIVTVARIPINGPIKGMVTLGGRPLDPLF